MTNILDTLALEFGTDKASNHHNYVELHDRHFNSLRDETNGLPEIGIGGKNYKGVFGSSLKMWAGYFKKAKICGIDIDPSADLDYGERIHVVIGDQCRRSVLDAALGKLPSVDIIIDDGSHMNTLTIASFAHLSGKLRQGGWYVIEDTVCDGELRLGNFCSQYEELILRPLRGLETNGRIFTKRNSADFQKINGDIVLKRI